MHRWCNGVGWGVAAPFSPDACERRLGHRRSGVGGQRGADAACDKPAGEDCRHDVYYCDLGASVQHLGIGLAEPQRKISLSSGKTTMKGGLSVLKHRRAPLKTLPLSELLLQNDGVPVRLRPEWHSEQPSASAASDHAVPSVGDTQAPAQCHRRVDFGIQLRE